MPPRPSDDTRTPRTPIDPPRPASDSELEGDAARSSGDGDAAADTLAGLTELDGRPAAAPDRRPRAVGVRSDADSRPLERAADSRALERAADDGAELARLAERYDAEPARSSSRCSRCDGRLTTVVPRVYYCAPCVRHYVV